jgi:mRNA-degrading endonuclease RelE of RelBE toxin-antitoxin system
MTWNLRIANRVRKALARLPAKDRLALLDALEDMSVDPFGGDIVRLKAQPTTWRRRVGAYRIFFDVSPSKLTIDIIDVRRRTY